VSFWGVEFETGVRCAELEMRVSDLSGWFVDEAGMQETKYVVWWCCGVLWRRFESQGIILKPIMLFHRALHFVCSGFDECFELEAGGC